MLKSSLRVRLSIYLTMFLVLVGCVGNQSPRLPTGDLDRSVWECVAAGNGKEWQCEGKRPRQVISQPANEPSRTSENKTPEVAAGSSQATRPDRADSQTSPEARQTSPAAEVKAFPQDNKQIDVQQRKVEQGKEVNQQNSDQPGGEGTAAVGPSDAQTSSPAAEIASTSNQRPGAENKPEESPNRSSQPSATSTAVSAGSDSPATYTIQLGAFASETQRDQFVVDMGMVKATLEYYESRRDGRTWWVITSGRFSTLSNARQEQASLENRYGLSETWVRPLAALVPTESDTTETNSVTTEQQLTSDNVEDTVSSELEAVQAGRYSIQLAAFRDQRQLESFIQGSKIGSLPLRYFREDRNGRTWWVVTYGGFDWVRDARPEANRLELEYGLDDTWIRPVADLIPI